MDCDGFGQYLTLIGDIRYNVYFNFDLSVCGCVCQGVCGCH